MKTKLFMHLLCHNTSTSLFRKHFRYELEPWRSVFVFEVDVP